MSNPGTSAAETGFLSIDQAVEELNAAEAPEKQEEETEIPEAAPAAEGESGEGEPEGATAEAEAGEEAEGEAEVEETEQEALEPPQFWPAADKAKFAGLPRDVQETILQHEQTRTAATSKAMEEVAAKRKAAESDLSRLTQVLGVMDRTLPDAIQTFRSRWEGMDWNKVVDEYGAEAALKLRNDMEREQGVVQQLQAAKDDAEQIRYSKFVVAETAKLAEMCPDLADPKLGNERRVKLGQFLTSANVPASAIDHMSALEVSIAYDAMQWRNAKANAAKPAIKAPVSAAAPAKPTVRPTAAPAASRNPVNPRLQQLKSKRSLTMDEAVEMMTLQE